MAPVSGGPGPRKGRYIPWRLILFIGMLILVILLFYYRANIIGINAELAQARGEAEVFIRPLPFPYTSALGLTVSPGEGLTLERYLEALKFLTTTENTALGEGLGLEVGGAYIFYPPSPEWTAYFNPPGPEGGTVRQIYGALIRSRTVDVLESFGMDEDFSREMAASALETLTTQGLTISTWADRFKSPDNLSLSGGRGGQPNRLAYHLDLTAQAGLRFFWLGRTTPLLGQDTEISNQTFFSLYQPNRTIASSLEIMLAFGRHLGSVLTGSETDPIRNNRLLGPVTFRDGRKGMEYIRYLPSSTEAVDLASQLGGNRLDKLQDLGGRIVVTSRLTPTGSGNLFSPADLEILGKLKAANNDGRLLVTSTSRLLTLAASQNAVRWKVEEKDGEVLITIHEMDDPVSGPRPPDLAELAGLTFYVQDSTKARIFLEEHEVEVVRNLLDETGHESISLPWPRHRFPDLNPILKN